MNLNFNLNREQKKTVVVGMSGGVDSSVAALLLKKQGYRVIGLFMKNWDEKKEKGESAPLICQSTADYEDVIKVCETLDIPYYSIDLVEDYWNKVFKSFLQEYEKGHTPNPDILCNREIKFRVFFEKAMELGADYLATGHYCQKSAGPNFHLLKGLDPQKDQSYFLYTLKSEILKKVLFPIGHLPKNEVRKLAKEFRLATFAKKDSTGICFIGERNFPSFLGKYLHGGSGPFETLSGEVVGTHKGVSFYTIGQRRGLGLGGPGEAYFVVQKNLKRNAVIVVRGALHPALFVDELVATNITWVDENFQLPSLPFACRSKIRYRQSDQECVIEKSDEGKIWVRFLEAQRAVTVGQSIVFYDKEICLGGGIIETSGQTYFERGLPISSLLQN